MNTGPQSTELKLGEIVVAQFEVENPMHGKGANKKSTPWYRSTLTLVIFAVVLLCGGVGAGIGLGGGGSNSAGDADSASSGSKSLVTDKSEIMRQLQTMDTAAMCNLVTTSCTAFKGEDGEDGKDGRDGRDGINGNNGVCPANCGSGGGGQFHTQLAPTYAPTYALPSARISSTHAPTSLNGFHYDYLELENGFQEYGNGEARPRWTVLGSMCFLSGLMKKVYTKEGWDRIAMTTLGSHCRPHQQHVFFQLTMAGPTRITIRTDGTVWAQIYSSWEKDLNLYSGTSIWVTLAGIVFPVSENYFYVEMTPE